MLLVQVAVVVCTPGNRPLSVSQAPVAKDLVGLARLSRATGLGGLVQALGPIENASLDHNTSRTADRVEVMPIAGTENLMSHGLNLSDPAWIPELVVTP